MDPSWDILKPPRSPRRIEPIETPLGSRPFQRLKRSAVGRSLWIGKDDIPINSIHGTSMVWYTHMNGGDFYGFKLVGKYTVRPMDAMGDNLGKLL